MIKRASIIVCWLVVIGLGAFLRFDGLEKRPFHADEATGASITADRMGAGDYRFDPVHYHGPLLSSLTMPLARMRGEDSWETLTKLTPRLVTASAGMLLILTPLLLRRRFGDPAALLAAALLATSPLLAYYSRMFIHESLLVWFGVIALALLTKPPKSLTAIAVGFAVGLMFSTKETFAISIIAWLAAAAIIAVENRQRILQGTWSDHWTLLRMPLLLFGATALLSSLYFYTDGFRNPTGAIDAVRTFFVYETVQGHDKPFGYYFQLIAIPEKSGGAWWFGTPVIALALFAYASTFRKPASRGRLAIRFIAYAAVFHFLIYSLIGYKTPWLIALPWAHVCILAGCCVVDFRERNRAVMIPVALVVALAVFTQFTQARRATGRFASDSRNPFAYVPTSSDVERIAPWLQDLGTALPGIEMEPIAVVGTGYWPLPWYLRGAGKIGYWETPPEDLAAMPIVFTTPDGEPEVAGLLADTHTLLPRGLRTDAPLMLRVRNDIWKLWMESE
ncbi:MAG: flippase activity-associated protein Agl23 [Luteolibacter sp.]